MFSEEMTAARLVRRVMLLAALAALPGCGGDAGSGPSNASSLYLTAILPDGAPGSVPCLTPRELVNDLANVSAQAEVVDVTTATILGQTDLVVRGTDAGNVLELVGDFSFVLTSLPETVTLAVAILYQGRELEGTYAGDITLNSGIEVNVESFTIPPLTPQADGTLTANGVDVCVSSDAVDQGQPFCTTDQDIENQSLVYNPPTNRFSYSYRRPNVDWEDEGLRTIIVSVEGGLEPQAIYQGSVTLSGGDLIQGSGETAVTLQPVPQSGPGSVGEGLSGELTFGFADGRPPTEGGSAFVTRTVALACDATP